jgi:tetratricopeptide (TPR) repeat protein
MLDEFEPARQCFEEALTLFQSVGDRSGQADCIRGLGVVHRMLDEFEPARQCFEEALTLSRASATGQVKPTASEVWAMYIWGLMSLSRHGNVLKKP